MQLIPARERLENASNDASFPVGTISHDQEVSDLKQQE
jgi:hypothetical protein